MIATYTDGSPVAEGDRIRYKQAPGGMLPPSGNWTYGVAVPYPHPAHIREYAAAHTDWGYDLDELVLLNDRQRYFHIGGHIIERQSHEPFTGSAGSGDDQWCIEHQRHEWIESAE